MVTSATRDSGLSSAATAAPARGASAEQRERTTKNDLSVDMGLLSTASGHVSVRGPVRPRQPWTASLVGEFLDLETDDIVGLALDGRGRPSEAVQLGVCPVEGRQV